jgi:hypothetical protein
MPSRRFAGSCAVPDRTITPRPQERLASAVVRGRRTFGVTAVSDVDEAEVGR